MVRDGRGIKLSVFAPPRNINTRSRSLLYGVSVGQFEKVFDDYELDLTVHQLRLADLRFAGCSITVTNIQTYDAEGVSGAQILEGIEERVAIEILETHRAEPLPGKVKETLEEIVKRAEKRLKDKHFVA